MTKHDTVTGIILTPWVIGFQFPNSSGNACVSWARGAIIVIGAIPEDNRGRSRFVPNRRWCETIIMHACIRTRRESSHAREVGKFDFYQIEDGAKQ